MPTVCNETSFLRNFTITFHKILLILALDITLYMLSDVLKFIFPCRFVNVT